MDEKWVLTATQDEVIQTYDHNGKDEKRIMTREGKQCWCAKEWKLWIGDDVMRPS